MFVKRMPIIGSLIVYHNGERLHLHIRTCNSDLLLGLVENLVLFVR